MSLNNSLLILIKQNPGINFNEIYSKFSFRYKNVASAKSALMRSLKDMNSFGLIKKTGSTFFVTDKGVASMNIEMKDKLVLKLNQGMKKPIDNLDELVKLLVVLSQRGVADSDLLKNAKDTASFTIGDLIELKKSINNKRRHLKSMNLLLDQQIDKLRELDFNDSILLNFDDGFASKLIDYCRGQKIILETTDENILAKVPTHWIKQGIVSVDGENISLLIQLLSSTFLAKAVLYVPGMKIVFVSGKAKLFGPHKTISDFYSDLIVNLAIDEVGVEGELIKK